MATSSQAHVTSVGSEFSEFQVQKSPVPEPCIVEKSASPETKPIHSIKWRLAIQTLRQRFLLDNLELSSSDTPTQVVEKIVLAYRCRLSLLRRLINHFILFRRPVIESATMSCASFIDLEALALPNYILLDNRSRNDILTSALHKPAILDTASDSASFFATYDNFTVGHSGSMALICVVGFEFDCTAFFCFSVLVFLLCIGVGVLAGYLSRSSEVGCAFGGGLATLVAGLQLLVLKVLR
ncbi:hypothetical protein K469DRAFT_689496 [Zopfia rhizophila CBS 207.26]|uniref:Uncharacterized protein n=1 Tax=Zopfia rhizophila CBS 207.26 TaxID=1314779 RepID=A0A6A6E0S0_9PEZI|nr:hypothetical protein K469DRAFT_689496 [Zopfia rhizophila CBS 207.26]